MAKIQLCIIVHDFVPRVHQDMSRYFYDGHTQQGSIEVKDALNILQCTGQTYTYTNNNLAQNVSVSILENPESKNNCILNIYSCPQIFPLNVVTLHFSDRKIREYTLADSSEVLTPKQGDKCDRSLHFHIFYIFSQDYGMKYFMLVS